MAFESLWMASRLSYEILNTPLDEIASSMGLTEAMVVTEASIKNWKQWFPEEETEFHLDENDDLNEGENLFELKANQYTEQGQKRLQVYQIAKQLHLSGAYAKLEATLLEKANEAVDSIDPENIQGIQQLSGVLQSLTKDIQQLSKSMTLTQDNNGLPQLIIRDLSGANT